MSKSTTVNKNGFTPFANGGCQSLLQLTRMGSHPLLMSLCGIQSQVGCVLVSLDSELVEPGLIQFVGRT